MSSVFASIGSILMAVACNLQFTEPFSGERISIVFFVSDHFPDTPPEARTAMRDVDIEELADVKRNYAKVSGLYDELTARSGSTERKLKAERKNKER